MTTLSRQQVREVDRRAIEDYGMSGLVLMENAGRGVAEAMLAMGVLGPVVVCCGKGNNGGDGLVAARHLNNRGKQVRVLLFVDPAELRGDAAANWRIIERAGIDYEIFDIDVTVGQLMPRLGDADWIVDALLGTGATGEPQPPISVAIESVNAAGKKVMAVDLPSGLDCDTGLAARNTVVADCTCTFVAVKPGFLAAGEEHFTGKVHVIDIGVPRRLIVDIAGTPAPSSFSDAS
jgi:NAD(P)H-hydrate epimerase